jgi:hypothetical protein
MQGWIEPDANARTVQNTAEWRLQKVPVANGATRDARSSITHPARLHRRNTTPLIGERAVTRGRIARECGDQRYPFVRQLAAGTSAFERRDQGRARSSMIEFVASTMRRSSTNAP